MLIFFNRQVPYDELLDAGIDELGEIIGPAQLAVVVHETPAPAVVAVLPAALVVPMHLDVFCVGVTPLNVSVIKEKIFNGASKLKGG